MNLENSPSKNSENPETRIDLAKLLEELEAQSNRGRKSTRHPRRIAPPPAGLKDEYVYYEPVPGLGAPPGRATAVALVFDNNCAVIGVALQDKSDTFNRFDGRFHSLRYIKRALRANKAANTGLEAPHTDPHVICESSDTGVPELLNAAHPHVYRCTLPVGYTDDVIRGACQRVIQQYRAYHQAKRAQWFGQKYSRYLQTRARQLGIPGRVIVSILFYDPNPDLPADAADCTSDGTHSYNR